MRFGLMNCAEFGNPLFFQRKHALKHLSVSKGTAGLS